MPVVGLAHGSRHPAGGDAVRALMGAVARTGGMTAEPAFLDLAEPDLATVAAGFVAAGHRRAVVVPLLFTSAFHARVDVPEAVAAAARSAGLELLVTEILGTGRDVEDLLRQVLAAADVADAASVLLFAVGSSDAAANDAVHDLAARLGAGRTGAVRVAFGTAAPRTSDVLPQLSEPVAVLPLFLSPGLLLDPVLTLAAQHGWTVTPPLGDLVAPLVLRRWAAATSPEATRPGDEQRGGRPDALH